jgi:hypothetical protein
MKLHKLTIFWSYCVAAQKSSGRRTTVRRLRLEALEDRSLLAPVADMLEVLPDPRNEPVDDVTVQFSEPVTGVDISDFTLTRNGTNVDISGLAVAGANAEYHVDLSGVTQLVGTYVFTLVAAGSEITSIADASPLAAGDSDGWDIVDTSIPTADIVDITPDPRSDPVTDVLIRFSEPVTNVDIDDFSLTRNGTTVSLAGLTVSGGGDTYTLDLSTVTTQDGNYVLTLQAAGSDIIDVGGNAFVVDASDSWTIGPLADIVNIAPDPRTTPVGTVTITFSEPVTGVDIADFRLTRNGTNVALTGLTVGGSGANYTLNLSTVTATSGTYILTLVAAGSGIVDATGSPLAANASDTWVMDTTAPTADIVDVTPDPRTTPVGDVTIRFSEAVTGVDINDFKLTRNGTNVAITADMLSGSGATYTLNLASVTGVVGSYTLTLTASGSGITDAAGNALTAGASDSFSIDDVSENNDTLRTAIDLGRLNGSVTVGALSLIDANDWFRFTTRATGKAGDNVTIKFSNAAGNLNLELYSLSGQRLRSSSTTNDVERISLSGLPAGTYYVRVFGAGGATNPSYMLTINAPRVLVDDAYEQNDTRSTARNLGTLTGSSTISSLVMLDGHDWYRFRTTSRGISGNSVAINFQNANGNLNLELYNANGVRIASSSGFTNKEQISLAGRASGTYFVHVTGAHNPNYSLTINAPAAAAVDALLADASWLPGKRRT